MKLIGLALENLCVPCHAACRYCLLSSCKAATGVDYARGKALAQRLRDEIRRDRPDLSFTYYIGYCMDTPDLADYIRTCQEMGMPSGRFLQLNGLRIRNEADTLSFVQCLAAQGVETIDLTFYGLQEYHDRFAGRKGDFDFLLRILQAAAAAHLKTEISIPLLKTNLQQMEHLMALLSSYAPEKIFLFLPHSKGRGRLIAHERITQADLEGLSPAVRQYFTHVKTQTEAQWLKEPLEEPASRILTLALQPENIHRLEKMTLDEMIGYLENLDDAYLHAMPSISELAARYGKPENQQLFRIRDLHLRWQQQFLQECGRNIYDMHDESHHFSIHL